MRPMGCLIDSSVFIDYEWSSLDLEKKVEGRKAVVWERQV